MKFFSKDLSDKLTKLGCKSESEFHFALGSPMRGLFHANECQMRSLYIEHSAFTESDFLGTSEQAKENCRLVWGGEETGSDYNNFFGHNVTAHWHHRHAMLDSEDSEKYILDTMLNEEILSPPMDDIPHEKIKVTSDGKEWK
jgi:hypothetical protein